MQESINYIWSQFNKERNIEIASYALIAVGLFLPALVKISLIEAAAKLFLILAFTGFGLWLFKLRQRIPSDNSFMYKIAVCSIVLLVLFLYGGNLLSGFGITDDHEIASWIGPDGHITPREIPSILMSTELGQFGDYSRFRPSYYAVRIGESFLWGLHPSLWYLVRILISVFSMWCLFHLLHHYIGTLPAALMVYYISSFPMWKDIFSRLGPGETYAVLGLSIFALGYFNLLRVDTPHTGNRTTKLSWIAVFFGALLAMGAKENFLILVAPTLYLMFVAFKRKSERVLASILTTGLCIYALWIASAVTLAVSKAGVDINSTPATLASRTSILLDTILLPTSRLMLLAIVVLGGLVLYTRKNVQRRELAQISTEAFIATLFCYFVYLTQMVFYNGELPLGNRYDFPWVLCEPIFFVIIARTFLDLLSEIGADFKVIQGLKIGLVIGLCLSISITGFFIIVRNTAYNVRGTQIFKARLDAATAALSESPSIGLVIESHKAMDYEPIVSWTRWIQSRGVTNPIFVRLHGYSSNSEAPGLTQRLAKSMENASANGIKGNNFTLSPLSELEKVSKCYSLQLSGNSVTQCVNIP